MKLIKLTLFTILILLSIKGIGQYLYKTPSGKKYHLSSCRMVENVSMKLITESDINTYNLTPCKICIPPMKYKFQRNYSSSNKAVGESVSVQCKGKTQSGSRCKHKTRLANGYCYQHTKQNSTSYSKPLKQSSTSSICGAKNKNGGFCKRKVKGGGHCYQHN